MTEDREASIRLTIQNLVSEHDDRLFEKFDQLHKRDIHDDDVKKALTDLHLADLADGYEDWMNDGEPVREDEDGPLDQGEHLVTDPGDAPSYTSLGEVRIPPGHTRFYPEAGGILDIPNHLVDTFRRGGAEAMPVEEGRIDNGVFYAERSNDGVHWHVYKKRNADDNGAYIATTTSRHSAQFILNSLGTGITNFIERD